MVAGMAGARRQQLPEAASRVTGRPYLGSAPPTPHGERSRKGHLNIVCLHCTRVGSRAHRVSLFIGRNIKIKTKSSTLTSYMERKDTT